MPNNNSRLIRDKGRALESYEEKNRMLLLANADYEHQKKTVKGHLLTIQTIEKAWSLNRGELTMFRGNHNRRMFGKVKIVKGPTK